MDKGLWFIPNRTQEKLNRLELENHLTQYHRRLKLAVFFGDSNGKGPPFTPTSTREAPMTSLPPTVKDEMRFIYLFFRKIFLHHIMKRDDELLKHVGSDTQETFSNLTPGEERALEDLKRDRSIVIKPADKGNSVVILDRDQFLKEKKLGDNWIKQNFTLNWTNQFFRTWYQ